MLMPKKVKYRKKQRGKRRGRAKGGDTLAFGDYGLQALETGWVTARQIEAGRVAANRATLGQAKIWIRIFPHKPVSSKPAEVRMGKGKGSPDYWAARVHPGRIMFELDGVPEDVARRAFELASAKLPVQTKFIKRLEED